MLRGFANLGNLGGDSRVIRGSSCEEGFMNSDRITQVEARQVTRRG